MFLISREPLGDSNNALNIVFYSTWLLILIIGKRSLSCYIMMTSVLAAVLFILLCTVAILHCILRRQLRQYVQSSQHSVVILQISASESSVQEKTNHDNPVASIQVSKYTSFPKESGSPFRFSHLSPSSLEKASDNDVSNSMILRLSTSDVSFL